MTLDDMRMLLTIAKCGNLTAAAQTLYVSQPALSKRLNRFEEELGAQLFERAQGAHRLTLTPAGKLLIPFAEKWEDLQQEVGMLHDINSRVHFFVDAVDSVGICVLSDAIYAYHQKRPDTELVLKQHDSRECYAAVHDRIADIAFVVQEHFYQNIITTPLYEERMQLLTCESSGLTGVVDVHDLNWEKEVVINWNADYMRWRQNSLHFSRHPNVTTWSLSMALPYLRNEGCWAMAPQTAADHAIAYCPDLRYLPISNPPPPRVVYWIEEYGRHHDASDELLEILRQQMEGREGIHWL